MADRSSIFKETVTDPYNVAIAGGTIFCCLIDGYFIQGALNCYNDDECDVCLGGVPGCIISTAVASLYGVGLITAMVIKKHFRNDS